MNAVELLKAARAAIQNPENWTQGEYAKDADGRHLDETKWAEQTPTCMCSVGAVAKAGGLTIAAAEGSAAVGFLSKAVGGGDCAIVDYNDAHTHEEVLVAFDTAIELATNAQIITNLNSLIAAVEAQPEEQFDLSYFRKDRKGDNVCGTLFCTVGLACTMPKFQAEGFALIATPKDYAPGEFIYHVEVNGVDIRDSEVTDTTFGPDSWYNLFTPAGDSRFDTGLGYNFADPYGGDEANMTDKELAIARLKKQIEILKGDAA